MNVEASTQPSDMTGESRATDPGEGVSGAGDFTAALRGAIGEDGSAEGARNDSDTSEEAERDNSGRSADSESSADQDDVPDSGAGTRPELDADLTADAQDESTAEELALGSAQAAADTGALGALLGGRQVAARDGAGLSDSQEAEGTSSVLDSNRRDAKGGRAALTVEAGATIDVASRGVASSGAGSQTGAVETELDSAPNVKTAERLVSEGPTASDTPDTLDIPSAPDTTDAAESELRSAEVVSSTVQVGNEALAGTVEGNAERGAESAAPPSAIAEGPVSREVDASVRADAGTDAESPSQGDREDSNESRDPSERQAASDQRPSLAEQEVQAGAAAEAAAAYASAAASRNARPDESVAVENGIAVAGAVPVTAPENAPAPTATTAPTANAPQPAAASDAIAVQTEWLATRGGGSALLRLNPAELGEIEIRVSLRGGVVEVVMIAQEAATQTLAEEQSERLSQAFANRDLRMDSFDVRRGDPNAPSNDASGQFAQSSQQGDDRNGQNGQAGAGSEGAAFGQTGDRAASSAPVMPQILTTGPEASVDLRI